MLAQADFSKTVLRIAHVAKPKTPLELKVELVINLIKVRIKEMSIKDAAESLRLHVVDLRQSIMYFFDEEEVTAKQYSEGLNTYVDKAPLVRHKALKESTNEVLIAHEKIFMAISKKIESEIVVQNMGNSAFELLNNYPQDAIQRWINSSIDIEFSLIAADLLMDGELSLSRFKITELIKFMEQNICIYGAFTIFFKLWETDYEKDQSRLTNNMRILASKYSFDYGKDITTYSKEEFYNFLHN
ncbi:hypothetical protein [Haliscomenobacter sp.]|uniref:hypothetical protein n=1 Tax=Haliscomenobacter sp. TaxID=2717303 RepID=UPI003BACC262